MEILRHLGCRADWQGRDLLVDAADLTRWDVPDHLMGRMRSSVVFLGAILARCGQAEMTYPGGCELGARPIDLHLAALRSMGAAIQETGGRLVCRRERLTGTEIVLSPPAWEPRRTPCWRPAVQREPPSSPTPPVSRRSWICRPFCRKWAPMCRGRAAPPWWWRAAHPSMAAYIRWWRTASWPLPIWRPPPAPAAISGWRAWTTVTSPPLPRCCVRRDAGLTCGETSIRLQAPRRLQSAGPIRTAPYPGFPTDAQAVLMASLLRSEGATVFVENIFDSRYRHVPEMVRMGADIRLEGRVAVVCGVDRLHGAAVRARELRGGAALVLAGLQAEGETAVTGVEHIQRGYEDLIGELAQLGADIRQEER